MTTSPAKGTRSSYFHQVVRWYYRIVFVFIISVILGSLVQGLVLGGLVSSRWAFPTLEQFYLAQFVLHYPLYFWLPITIFVGLAILCFIYDKRFNKSEKVAERERISDMAIQIQDQQPDGLQIQKPEHKPLLWVRAVVTIVIIAIVASPIATILILHSEGTTQGTNTLNIISIVIGIVASLLIFMLTFLQWFYSRPSGELDPSITSPLQQFPPLIHVVHPNTAELSPPPETTTIQQSETGPLTLKSLRDVHVLPLPPATSGLVGREKDQEWLESCIVEGKIVGVSGMGVSARPP